MTMKLYARLEVYLDDESEGEAPAIERIVNNDLDLAIWLRDRVTQLHDEHGTAWEAEVHLEPLTEKEEA